MASPGTKNTGRNLASQPAPGVRIFTMESAILFPPTELNKVHNVNNMTQPPSWEGKAILSALNALRKATSKPTNKATPVISD
jgi:hypothetical protein